jgi:hypothetical protein
MGGNKIFVVLMSAKDLLAQEGIARFTVKTPGRVWKFLRHNFSNASFELNGRSYKYFCSLFNFTFRTERAVEVPIALDYVKRNSNQAILEVGNVLNHYFKFKHDIVDKYENAEGVTNQDIVEYKTTKKYDLVISISTLEHVGYNEEPKDKNKVLAAIENMKSLLADSGVMLVTFPWGYNKSLDSLFVEGKLKFSEAYFLKRVSKNNDWKQVEFNEIKNSEFGNPYLYGNAIVIGKVNK